MIIISVIYNQQYYHYYHLQLLDIAISVNSTIYSILVFDRYHVDSYICYCYTVS